MLTVTPVVVHASSGTDPWTVVAAGGSVVAAIAACVALWFARQTVGVGQTTLKDTREAHRQEADDRRADLGLRRE